VRATWRFAAERCMNMADVNVQNPCRLFAPCSDRTLPFSTLRTERKPILDLYESGGQEFEYAQPPLWPAMAGRLECYSLGVKRVRRRRFHHALFHRHRRELSCRAALIPL